MGYSVDEVSQFSTARTSWLNIYSNPRYVLDVTIYIYIYTLILHLLYVMNLKNERNSWTD